VTDYDAVVLDLDGTLCEYVRGTDELLSSAFETVGIEPFFGSADYRERFDDYTDSADSIRDLRRRCFADIVADVGRDPDLGRAVADAYAAERDHTNVRFVDGAADLLGSLSDRYPLGLVTNGGPDMQNAKLDGLGVREQFETVVYAGHHVAAKPAPDPFHAALTELGVPSERAVYVGNDYENDVLGAAAAGVDAVLVGGAVDGEVDPVARVASPADALGLF